MAKTVDVPTPERAVEKQGRTKTIGYAAHSSTSPLQPFSFERREPGPPDVQIEILYCGVCHSDLHTVRNEWSSFMPTTYPAVPGHEIVGRVSQVGSKVRKFKEGDLAAVGCLVDSCRECESCKAGLEQHCERNATFTFNALRIPAVGHAAQVFIGAVEWCAPRRRASSVLCCDVVNSVTCAPKARANLTAMCPSPPRPTTPTFCPLPTFQWRNGEYVVMPAQSSGATAGRSRLFGTFST